MRELKKAYPVLAYELEIVEQQAELRSLEHALQQLSDRVRIPEIRNLALILVQSERLGTDVGAALLEFSASFRATLKQRAEAQANKASFWMTFPTILCLWISAGIILVGPLWYEFWNRREQTQELFRQRIEKLKEEKERKDKRAQDEEGPGDDDVCRTLIDLSARLASRPLLVPRLRLGTREPVGLARLLLHMSMS